MSVETVIAACATVTAVVALYVSITEGKAARDHSKRSVQPILQVRSAGFRTGQVAGLKVVNAGLGPAKIVESAVWLDGVEFGGTDKAGLDRLREAVGGTRPRRRASGCGCASRTSHCTATGSRPRTCRTPEPAE